jgi:hypothetical protein
VINANSKEVIIRNAIIILLKINASLDKSLALSFLLISMMESMKEENKETKVIKLKTADK